MSWRKPVTFGLSFGLTLITIGWVTGFLQMRPRVWARLLVVLAAVCVPAVGGMTVQAWRGVPSHFNTGTPVDRTVAMSLAAGGAGLVVVLGTFAVAALRGRVHGEPTCVWRSGPDSLVSLATGVAKGSILYRTAGPQTAYATAGSLKPVHGVSLHAVLVLPLLAARRFRPVAVTTALYTAATLTALALPLS